MERRMASDTTEPVRDKLAPALLDAFALYQKNGLRMPPVPRELATELRKLSEWRWGSDDIKLIDYAGFLAAAHTQGGAAAVAFGHVGHGVNSWWLCYRLTLDAIGVYFRTAYGGAYQDEEAAILRANTAAAVLEELIPAAAAAKAVGRLRGGHRLIVVDDEKRRRFWQIAGGADETHPSSDPLSDAMIYLSTPLIEDTPD
jgi:hypothetical protein